jgi:homoserine kinase
MVAHPILPPASATAFAPATVANVAAGFDVLGFAIEGVGDRVRATRRPPGHGVTIETIEGLVDDLPADPARNTASVAVRSLVAELRLTCGFSLAIAKGIPLASGMGGSAASAVAAVVAVNHLLARPLSPEALLCHAVAGERAASGSAHADNVGPCLLGGLTAVVAHDPPRVVPIPVPRGLRYVLVHPGLRLETRRARAVLPERLSLSDHVAQSMCLAGFLAGCFGSDLELIRRSMEDRVAEPARASLVPGFGAAKRAAIEAGAIGCAMAGAGPSVFAWVEPSAAERVERALGAAFAREGLTAEAWSGALGAPGARVETAAP